MSVDPEGSERDPVTCPDCGLPLLDHDTDMCPTIAALRTERDHHRDCHHQLEAIAIDLKAERDELRAALDDLYTYRPRAILRDYDKRTMGWRGHMTNLYMEDVTDAVEAAARGVLIATRRPAR